MGMDQSSAGFVQHTQKRNYYFIFLNLNYFIILCICAGLCAEEIHVCGEPAAIDFIKELMFTTGEEVEVRLWWTRHLKEKILADVSNLIIGDPLFLISVFFSLQVHNYQRLTPFSILDHAVESLDNLRPGDCIVCFSKNDIYSISRQIEARGQECAVIYGSLPPGEYLSGFIFVTWICHILRYTFLVLGWSPVCLQSCLNSLWHRPKKVLEELFITKLLWIY